MNISKTEVSIKQLRSLLGKTLNYKGSHSEIIEILNDGPQLVLKLQEPDNAGSKIQADQFGDPRRRLDETITLPVYNADRTEILPAVAKLLKE